MAAVVEDRVPWPSYGHDSRSTKAPSEGRRRDGERLHEVEVFVNDGERSRNRGSGSLQPAGPNGRGCGQGDSLAKGYWGAKGLLQAPQAWSRRMTLSRRLWLRSSISERRRARENPEA